MLFDLERDAVVCRVTGRLRRGRMDVTIHDWEKAGLLKPSVAVLDRIITAEKSLFISRLGSLSTRDRDVVRDRWNSNMTL